MELITLCSSLRLKSKPPPPCSLFQPSGRLQLQGCSVASLGLYDLSVGAHTLIFSIFPSVHMAQGFRWQPLHFPLEPRGSLNHLTPSPPLHTYHLRKIMYSVIPDSLLSLTRRQSRGAIWARNLQQCLGHSRHPVDTSRSNGLMRNSVYLPRRFSGQGLEPRSHVAQQRQ